jgi:peptidoglycan/LPS O-acetylase OafA/YrhL
LTADPAARRLDVDWLRIFAVYLLFPFHVGKVFDVAPFYHLKNAELSGAMGFFTGFVHQWHMRLLFVLAGWSLLASLRGSAAAGRGCRCSCSPRARRRCAAAGPASRTSTTTGPTSRSTARSS